LPDRNKKLSNIGPMIRNRRKQLQLTLKELSQKTGLSVAFLSQVERDITSPSLSSLAVISKSLEVRMSYFLDIPEEAGRITRKGKRPYFSLKNSPVTYSKITNEFPDSQLDGVINRTPPGFVSEKVTHDGEDLIYTLKGEGFIQVGEEKYILKEGDTIHYRGDIPHFWGNESDSEFVWLGVFTQPLFAK
jgi:quercetin dioxygenase-like cupin family protein